MKFSNILAVLSFVFFGFAFIIGCRGKDISSIASIGVKLSDSLLLESTQIIPYEDGFFVIHDIAKETGNIQMFILLLDRQFTLTSTAPLPSLKIDSFFNDTIFSVKSNSVGKPWFASGVSMPTQLIFKYTDSKSVSSSYNVSNKLVNKVTYDSLTNKIWFYFFKSDSLSIGVATNKADYIDTSFTRHFTIFDSLSVTPADITIDYRESVFVLTYLEKSPLRMIHEELLVPNDSIWRNFISSLKKR